MKSILVALVAMSAATCGYANDTTARVGAGGIELLKSDKIRMLQEILNVSTRSIRVRYLFLNESEHDIVSSVAFPMPPYRWNPRQSAIDANEEPMTSFVARVDGSNVKTKVMRRALAGQRDITESLRSFGLSEAQIFETFADSTLEGNGLTAQQAASVQELLGTKTADADWQVAEALYWEQAFPSHKDVVVEHEYQPFVGMVYGEPYQKGTWVGDWNLIPSSQHEPGKNPAEACIGEGTGNALAERVKSLARTNPNIVKVTLNDVEYVLGTGRNWRGPIGDFTLTIEKDSPDQLVSLCFPGKPKRTGPTTLEFKDTDFTPPDRLIVYFYTVRAENE